MEGSHDPFIFAPELLQNESDTLNPIHYDITHPDDDTLLYDPLSTSYLDNQNALDAENDWSNLQLMFTGNSPCNNNAHGATNIFQQSFLSQPDIIPEIDLVNHHLLSTSTSPNEILQESVEIPEPTVRMTKQSLRALKEWKTQHGDTAKPSPQQIRRLATQTNLSLQQIHNWFSHSKRRNKSFGHRQQGKMLIHESSTGMNIPKRPPTPVVRDLAYNTPPTPATFGDMCPMERWENSPPEHEAALVSDIAKALSSHSDIHYINSTKSRASTRSASRGDSVSTGCSSINGRHRDPSESSIDSVDVPGSIAWSDNSGQSSTHSSKSGAEYRRRARKRRTNPLLMNGPKKQSLRGDVPKTYQCTFCTDSFKTKYDWSRHEKSLHLALESWTCSPFGSTNRDGPDGQPTCAYCNAPSPTEEHLDTHRHLACSDRPVSERTYYRKDHLRQHLRLVHSCRFIPSMETWKHTPSYVRSRCGFCTQTLTTWQDRIDHLASHFRDGYTMAHWSGGWGFEPHILLLIENGMPPFLIHHERNTVAPFSGSISLPEHQQRDQGEERAEEGAKLKLYSQQYTYPDTQEISWYECFESQLATYINATLAEEGRLPTDKEIQDTGRRYVYDGDDPWHQTIADNAMWLEDFRERYGFVESAKPG